MFERHLLNKFCPLYETIRQDRVTWVLLRPVSLNNTSRSFNLLLLYSRTTPCYEKEYTVTIISLPVDAWNRLHGKTGHN